MVQKEKSYKYAEEEVREIIGNWAEAVRNRDMKRILAHHAEEIVMYDVPKPFESIGIEAYRKTWDIFFDDTKPGVFDIKELQVTAGDDIAFCYGTMTCSEKSNSQDFVNLDFRLTVGLKKVEGQWIILHEHHSIPAL
jgi:ketosteroid isomerase-like protein